MVGAAAGIALVGGCRERAAAVVRGSKVAEAVAQLVPVVERAAGMRFKRPPTVAIRSREQVRAYLVQKLDEDLPRAELTGMTAAYRLFGLIPDSLDLRQLFLELYSEQVLGYFDPDSGALYVMSGVDPDYLRLTIAHELVHALQAQYVNVDSLISQRDDQDRRTAAQALLEGHATLVQTLAAMPEKALADLPPFFTDLNRRTIAEQQGRMPVFAKAPLIVREELIFPYVAGADWVRWYRLNRSGPFPLGRDLPVSSEQILHPERYGDRPVSLEFPAGAADGVYDNNLGEFEIRVLLAQLTGRESDAAAVAQGWGGDRYRVYLADDALVWYTVWDDQADADAAYVQLKAHWRSSRAGERRVEVDRVQVDGKAAVRLVDAPPGWAGWRNLPVPVVPTRD